MRFLLPCVIALAAGPLAAQTADTVRSRPDTIPAQRLAPDTLAPRRAPVALEEVRVTGEHTDRYAAPRALSATKTGIPLLDTPQSATVVTRALIADQGMQGMSDVVRYMPGITIGQGEGHRDQTTIRGNSTTADFFIDGVRDDAQYIRDLYNVERVEALKGSNALLFGRGGGGGIINRVTKQADRLRHRELTLQTGSFGARRGTLDAGSTLGSRAALRLDGLYERSNSYRDEVGVERWGVNPTLAIFGTRTLLRAGYEHFDDERTVDRGIPSFRGAPAPASIRTFFGDPSVNHAVARVDNGHLLVEHATRGGATLRNQTRYAWYDKFYQNITPRDVSADGSTVTLSAYNHPTQRTNIFNQTELAWNVGSAGMLHTLFTGVEVGRQGTDNSRKTGYFANGTSTTTTVPFDRPTATIPVTFRPGATDADNHVTTTVAALYAQDQITFSQRWQAVVGARWERFGMNFDDHRAPNVLRRADVMVSPRGGLIFKPTAASSLYASYGISHLPSSGDQFASLNTTTVTLEPERFTNYEVGGKWDVRPALGLTGAVYRLDRTNTQARDPNDPSLIVQSGAQRTVGYELGVVGAPVERWQVAGGFARQRAWIADATSAAWTGATVPLVPTSTLSLWNRLQVIDAIGIGAGAVHQARSYAAIDNAVVLPAFTRIDAALFVDLPSGLGAQLNVENLGNARYFPTSQGNSNILPGAPRSWRLTIGARL